MECHVYLKIEEIASCNPVNLDRGPSRLYQRDCGCNHGHDGTIPASDVAAPAVPALIYQEHLHSAYQIPKPDEIVIENSLGGLRG